jgi:hypothetical protein
MATEEFKAITITGGAIADLGMKKRRGRTRKSGGAEADDTPPSTIMKVVPSPAPPPAPSPAPSPAPPVPPAPTVGGAPNLFRTSNQIGPSLTFEQNQSQQGGTKYIKVELKKKHLSKKVTLNPKKQDVPPVKQPAHTKKSRKFVLGISSMHKRVTRAKKIQHKLDKMPLEELRKQLIASKLIKATSKAPEAILRQIAKDSQLVGKKIL